jgi:hypothetical protein
VRAYYGTLHLLTLLVQAILILIPQPMHLLGVELCVVNLIGLALPLSNVYRYFCRNTDVGRRGGLMIYRAATYGASYLVGLAGGRPIDGIAIRSNVLDLERDDIATSQLAVDGQIEQGQITGSLVDLEFGPDRPDVFLPQWRLGSDQLSFIPGYPFGGGQQEIRIVLHGHAPSVAEEMTLPWAGRL